MRHRKHHHTLRVTSAHRSALLSNLGAALLTHGRIETTLSKAKALRPFIEKIITMAVHASRTEDKTKALHYRRLALSRVRDRAAVEMLFKERVKEFANRAGGYTRIYKLIPRIGDGADMALIELIPGADEGYPKRKKTRGGKAKAAEAIAEPAANPAEAAPEAAAGAPVENSAEPAGDAAVTKS